MKTTITGAQCLCALMLVYLFSSCLSTDVSAAIKTFTGTGNFSDATKWNGSALPVAGDDLTINGTCTVDNNVLTDNVAYENLIIGGTSTGVLNWAAGGTNKLSVYNLSSLIGGSSLNMTNGGTLIIRGVWTSANLAFTSGAGTILYARNTDLPNPDPSVNTFPSGSLIIAMDNTWQLNGAARFNLKAYGLVVTLVNNHVKVYWAIKAGKAKDAKDFTAATTRLFPSTVAASSKDFKAGPFIIDKSDTSLAGPIIRTYNSAQTASNKVNVYRLDSTTSIDVRYTLTRRPNIAVLTDGNSETIHTTYLINAGVPASNYTVIPGTAVNSVCYSFASEPHSTATGSLIDSVRKFVSNGGNFLAQCRAVSTYENAANGRFQTTGGITVENTWILPQLVYPNASLSYTQYEGGMNPNIGGLEQNWALAAGSAFKNGTHHHIDASTATTVYGASVSKAVSNVGGLVFYLGGHDFNGTTVIQINGQRMYLNAMLTPSTTGDCYVLLPMQLLSFSAVLNKGTVALQWSTASEHNSDYFTVERTIDESSFETVCQVKAAGESIQTLNYQTTDKNPSPGVSYYRLKQIDRDGSASYSDLVAIEITNRDQISISPNPVTDGIITIRVQNHPNEIIQTVVMDLNGKVIFDQTDKLGDADQSSLVIDKLDNLPGGLYILRVSSATGILNRKITIY